MKTITQQTQLLLLGMLGLGACAQPNAQTQQTAPKVVLEAKQMQSDFDTSVDSLVFEERAWDYARAITVALGIDQPNPDQSNKTILPDTLEKDLEPVLQDALLQQPALAKRPVWLGEISQLVEAEHANAPTKEDVALVVLMTENDAGQSVWAAKVAVNLNDLKIVAHHINTNLEQSTALPEVEFDPTQSERGFVKRVLRQSTTEKPDLESEPLTAVVLYPTDEANEGAVK